MYIINIGLLKLHCHKRRTVHILVHIDTVLCTATRLSKELMREVQAIEVNLQNCIFDAIDDTYNM